MQFGERLEQLRKEKGVTRKAVLDAVGASHNQYQNWVTRGNVPLPSTLEKLATYFGVSVEYLKGEQEREEAVNRAIVSFIEYLEDNGYSYEEDEHGEITIGKNGHYMYYDSMTFAGLAISLQNKGKPELAMQEWEMIAFPTENQLRALFNTRKRGRQTRLPVYGNVSAGKGCYTDTDVVAWEVADEKYDSDEYFYLLVHGDSMSPDIKDGDYALVHSQDYIESGQIGVCVVDDEGFIKKIEYGEDTLTLVSINPYYPPRKFEKYDMNNVHIIGRVIETKRKY